MTYNKIHDLIEDWDNIQLEYDVMPKSYPSKADDIDEVVDRFWESIFSAPDIVHPEIEQDDEEEKTDEEED